MEPITFHWIWKDLIGKTWWNPSDSTGIDKVWVLKSHESNQIPLDLIRFGCHNLMNPKRFHWIWSGLSLITSWIPSDSTGYHGFPCNCLHDSPPHPIGQPSSSHGKKTSGIKAFLMKYHQKPGDFDGLMPQCYKWILSHPNGFPIVIPTISLFPFYYHSLVSIWWWWWNHSSINPMSDPCPHSIHPSPF